MNKNKTKTQFTNVRERGTASVTWLYDHSQVVSLLKDLGFIISTASIIRKSTTFKMNLGSTENASGF